MKGSKYLLPAIFKTVALPLIAAYVVVSKSASAQKHQIFAYLFVIPIFYVVRSQASLRLSDWRAAQSGGRTIPRVRGRWSLNLDVLCDWVSSGEEEAGHMIRELEKQYGATFNTRVLGEDQIITTDPKVMRQVLVDQFDNFVKGDKLQERAMHFLGDGIFNSDGDRWKFHRNLTRPFFHPSHVNFASFTPLIARFVQDLPSHGPFDIQERLQLLTTQLSLRWMCGEDISEKEARAVGDALTVAQAIVARRVKIGTVWPLFELFVDPLVAPMKTIRAFIKPRIEQAKVKLRKQGNAEQRADVSHLIDRLVQSTPDDKLIEDQLINILLASRDTTASLLTFCTYAMCENPEVAQRLRKELVGLAGESATITKEMMRECKYTRRFINEVLRLYPPVPLNIRRSVKPALLPSSDGQLLYMPANTSIILSTIVMQSSISSWGDDAKVFNPDRWIEVGGERENYMPWHLGPRMCLGQPFALTVVQTFLIILFRHLERSSPAAMLRFASPPEDLQDQDEESARSRRRKRIKADVVLSVKGGLWVEISS